MIDVKEKIKNINEFARNAQKKNILLFLASVGVLILVGWSVMSPSSADKKYAKEASKQQAVNIAGAIDSQFTKDASQKALEEQQGQLKNLHEQIEGFGIQMEVLQKSLEDKNSDANSSDQMLVQELQARIAELENASKKPGGQFAYGLDSAPTEINARGITTTSFSYNEDTQNRAIKIKTVKDYVPPGTFAKAVLLSGADTNAGTHGQTDTVPITMRILDNGILPNGEKSSLKGCFVTAAAYGDASSERGQIRLQRLSCVRNPGKYIIDIPVEGTINDMGGSDGIRGHVVMRNNKLIWNAGISGVLSGLGGAAQQSLTTQSVSPLGAVSSIQPNKVLQSGLFGGANTALSKLADYYIKLADMYHPIVQVHAGSQVNIVFLKGFSLTEGQLPIATKEVDRVKNAITSQSDIQQNLIQNTKDLSLGQSVDMNNSINNEVAV